AALDGGSPQNLLRALRGLFDHSFLDRPPSQLARLLDVGPQPMVYGLGKKGAAVLRDHGHLLNGGVDWTEKNKRAGSTFIMHTLALADVMVGLEIACRERPNLSLLTERGILAAAPARTRGAREPLRWRVENIENGRREVWSV